MPEVDRVSRTETWYELNLAGLTWREACRATNWFLGTVLAVSMLVPRLSGVVMRGGFLLPSRFTLLWPVDPEEVEIPREITDLGFELLGCFEMPEVSGENVTCLFHDPTRTVYCELVHVRTDQGVQNSSTSLSTALLQPWANLKTVLKWSTEPLDKGPEYVVQCVPGSLRAAYDAHLARLRALPGQPQPTSFEAFVARSHEAHAKLCPAMTARRLYVEARDDAIDALLKRKNLRWK